MTATVLPPSWFGAGNSLTGPPTHLSASTTQTGEEVANTANELSADDGKTPRGGLGEIITSRAEPAVKLQLVLQTSDHIDSERVKKAVAKAQAADIAARCAKYERDLLAHQLHASSEERSRLSAQLRLLSQEHTRAMQQVEAAEHNAAAAQQRAVEAVAEAEELADQLVAMKHQQAQLLYMLQTQSAGLQGATSPGSSAFPYSETSLQSASPQLASLPGAARLAAKHAPQPHPSCARHVSFDDEVLESPSAAADQALLAATQPTAYASHSLVPPQLDQAAVVQPVAATGLGIAAQPRSASAPPASTAAPDQHAQPQLASSKGGGEAQLQPGAQAIAAQTGGSAQPPDNTAAAQQQQQQPPLAGPSLSQPGQTQPASQHGAGQQLQPQPLRPLQLAASGCVPALLTPHPSCALDPPPSQQAGVSPLALTTRLLQSQALSHLANQPSQEDDEAEGEGEGEGGEAAVPIAASAPAGPLPASQPRQLHVLQQARGSAGAPQSDLQVPGCPGSCDDWFSLPSGEHVLDEGEVHSGSSGDNSQDQAAGLGASGRLDSCMPTDLEQTLPPSAPAALGSARGAGAIGSTGTHAASSTAGGDRLPPQPRHPRQPSGSSAAGPSDPPGVSPGIIMVAEPVWGLQSDHAPLSHAPPRPPGGLLAAALGAAPPSTTRSPASPQPALLPHAAAASGQQPDPFAAMAVAVAGSAGQAGAQLPDTGASPAAGAAAASTAPSPLVTKVLSGAVLMVDPDPAAAQALATPLAGNSSSLGAATSAPPACPAPSPPAQPALPHSPHPASVAAAPGMPTSLQLPPGWFHMGTGAAVGMTSGGFVTLGCHGSGGLAPALGGHPALLLRKSPSPGPSPAPTNLPSRTPTPASGLDPSSSPQLATVSSTTSTATATQPAVPLRRLSHHSPSARSEAAPADAAAGGTDEGGSSSAAIWRQLHQLSSCSQAPFAACYGGQGSSSYQAAGSLPRSARGSSVAASPGPPLLLTRSSMPRTPEASPARGLLPTLSLDTSAPRLQWGFNTSPTSATGGAGAGAGAGAEGWVGGGELGGARTSQSVLAHVPSNGSVIGMGEAGFGRVEGEGGEGEMRGRGVVRHSSCVARHLALLAGGPTPPRSPYLPSATGFASSGYGLAPGVGMGLGGGGEGAGGGGGSQPEWMRPPRLSASPGTLTPGSVTPMSPAAGYMALPGPGQFPAGGLASGAGGGAGHRGLRHTQSEAGGLLSGMGVLAGAGSVAADMQLRHAPGGSSTWLGPGAVTVNRVALPASTTPGPNSRRSSMGGGGGGGGGGVGGVHGAATPYSGAMQSISSTPMLSPRTSNMSGLLLPPHPPASLPTRHPPAQQQQGRAGGQGQEPGQGSPELLRSGPRGERGGGQPPSGSTSPAPAPRQPAASAAMRSLGAGAPLGPSTDSLQHLPPGPALVRPLLPRLPLSARGAPAGLVPLPALSSDAAVALAAGLATAPGAGGVFEEAAAGQLPHTQVAGLNQAVALGRGSVGEAGAGWGGGGSSSRLQQQALQAGRGALGGAPLEPFAASAAAATLGQAARTPGGPGLASGSVTGTYPGSVTGTRPGSGMVTPSRQQLPVIGEGGPALGTDPDSRGPGLQYTSSATFHPASLRTPLTQQYAPYPPHSDHQHRSSSHLPSPGGPYSGLGSAAGLGGPAGALGGLGTSSSAWPHGRSSVTSVAATPGRTVSGLQHGLRSTGQMTPGGASEGAYPPGLALGHGVAAGGPGGLARGLHQGSDGLGAHMVHSHSRLEENLQLLQALEEITLQRRQLMDAATGEEDEASDWQLPAVISPAASTTTTTLTQTTSTPLQPHASSMVPGLDSDQLGTESVTSHARHPGVTLLPSSSLTASAQLLQTAPDPAGVAATAGEASMPGQDSAAAAAAAAADPPLTGHVSASPGMVPGASSSGLSSSQLSAWADSGLLQRAVLQQLEAERQLIAQQRAELAAEIATLRALRAAEHMQQQPMQPSGSGGMGVGGTGEGRAAAGAGVGVPEGGSYRASPAHSGRLGLLIGVVGPAGGEAEQAGVEGPGPDPGVHRTAAAAGGVDTAAAKELVEVWAEGEEVEEGLETGLEQGSGGLGEEVGDERGDGEGSRSPAVPAGRLNSVLARRPSVRLVCRGLLEDILGPSSPTPGAGAAAGPEANVLSRVGLAAAVVDGAVGWSGQPAGGLSLAAAAAQDVGPGAGSGAHLAAQLGEATSAPVEGLASAAGGAAAADPRLPLLAGAALTPTPVAWSLHRPAIQATPQPPTATSGPAGPEQSTPAYAETASHLTPQGAAGVLGPAGEEGVGPAAAAGAAAAAGQAQAGGVPGAPVRPKQPGLHSAAAAYGPETPTMHYPTQPLPAAMAAPGVGERSAGHQQGQDDASFSFDAVSPFTPTSRPALGLGFAGSVQEGGGEAQAQALYPQGPEGGDTSWSAATGSGGPGSEHGSSFRAVTPHLEFEEGVTGHGSAPSFNAGVAFRRPHPATTVQAAGAVAGGGRGRVSSEGWASTGHSSPTARGSSGSGSPGMAATPSFPPSSPLTPQVPTASLQEQPQAARGMAQPHQQPLPGSRAQPEPQPLTPSPSPEPAFHATSTPDPASPLTPQLFGSVTSKLAGKMDGSLPWATPASPTDVTQPGSSLFSNSTATYSSGLVSAAGGTPVGEEVTPQSHVTAQGHSWQQQQAGEGRAMSVTPVSNLVQQQQQQQQHIRLGLEDVAHSFSGPQSWHQLLPHAPGDQDCHPGQQHEGGGRGSSQSLRPASRAAGSGSRLRSEGGERGEGLGESWSGFDLPLPVQPVAALRKQAVLHMQSSSFSDLPEAGRKAGQGQGQGQGQGARERGEGEGASLPAGEEGAAEVLSVQEQLAAALSQVKALAAGVEAARGRELAALAEKEALEHRLQRLQGGQQ